jgi:hypothetical protein
MKPLPFIPRLKARVRFWQYGLENGQTVRYLREGVVIDRFDKPALHSALCCVRVSGDKSAGLWMSARSVMTIARKA